MPEPVLPILARPPRYGIVASAPVLTDGRWEDGFVFLPDDGDGDATTRTGAGGSALIDPADYTGGLVDGEPFIIWEGDTNSAMDIVRRDWDARLLRRLNAHRSFRIGTELWRGTLGLVNRSLTDPASDTLTDSPAAPVAALACIEDALGTCGKGQPGMVHMTTGMLTHLAAAGAVTLAGQQWMTPNGHLVVPDAGYTGSGPGDVTDYGSQWMYGSDLIALRLSDVQVIPGSYADARSLAQSMNRRLNSIVAWAQQLVAWQWSETCHVAAEVDVPLCAVGGAS